jgi:hypothetical protein
MDWRWVGAGGAHRCCEQRFLRRIFLRQVQIQIDAELCIFAGWHLEARELSFRRSKRGFADQASNRLALIKFGKT